MISIAVCAHHHRTPQAEHLTSLLDATLVLDTGIYGDAANHDRAWAATLNTEAEWSLVIEDDAEPIDNFKAEAEAALRSAPTDVVSLYCGTSRPPQIQRRISLALARNTHWLTTDRPWWGVAIAIRQPLVQAMLDDMHTDDPSDQRIGAWCRTHQHRVAISNPSLVDHNDGPSVIHTRADGQPRHQPRKAWNVGTHPTWTNTTTHL